MQTSQALIGNVPLKSPINSLPRPALDPPRRWRILQRFSARCASSATPRKLLSCCWRAAAGHCAPAGRTSAGTWTGERGPPTTTSHRAVPKQTTATVAHTEPGPTASINRLQKRPLCGHVADCGSGKPPAHWRSNSCGARLD